MNQSLVEPLKNKKVCFVHDWLIGMRGGEKVLEAMCEMYPKAPIYTLFLKRQWLSSVLQSKTIHSSFLQFIPFIEKIYRYLLPIFPIAIKSLNVRKYDLVISSSHCVAKAIKIKQGAVHICYCHTPMRYLWGFSEEYLGKLPNWVRMIVNIYFTFLRKWDVVTSKRVTAFIANSKNTADKIFKVYGKAATIIHPPVEIPNLRACAAQNKSNAYFLIVSALVPYKRIDLAIGAFNQLKKWRLKIIGDGPDLKPLEKIKHFDGIEFEGWLEENELRERYLNCRALIFPGEEDFGIVPIEAQSFGKPVIAFGKGGVTETVLPYNTTRTAEESTGLFFFEPTPQSLIEALNKFQYLKFDKSFIKNHAMKFGVDHFKEEFTRVLTIFTEQFPHAYKI